MYYHSLSGQYLELFVLHWLQDTWGPHDVSFVRNAISIITCRSVEVIKSIITINHFIRSFWLEQLPTLFESCCTLLDTTPLDSCIRWEDDCSFGISTISYHNVSCWGESYNGCCCCWETYINEAYVGLSNGLFLVLAAITVYKL